MKLSGNGLELIKKFEGFRPSPYKDIAGLLTIGFGHLILKNESFTSLTKEEAETLLLKDVKWAEDCVNEKINVQLTQNQFDALVSFVFNLGCTAFFGSTLRKLVNNKDFTKAKGEFLKWCNAGGKKSPGLLRRRIDESVLFDQ